MKDLAIMLVAIGLFTGGCASTETVKEARGQGISRTYQSAYDAVYDAAVAAAKAKELEVLETDRASGRLLLSHGVTWLSWGERIAVFVKSAASGTTEVEIVSKPVMSPLNFPPDWDKILLEQIAIELRARR